MMKAKQTIGWGMIGCGDVCERKSGPAFDRVAGSRRVAVMARTEARVRDYAERHGVPKWTTEARRVVEDPEVEVVYISTPPGSHLEYTRLAAEAGKAVYVEKPMARNAAECAEMIRVCREAGVPLWVAYYRRGMEVFRRARQVLVEGRIGRLLQVRTHLHLPPRGEDRAGVAGGPARDWWRLDPEVAGPGGYFLDMGSHTLDLLDWMLGPVAEARGVGTNRAGHYGVEDTVGAVFRFASGVVGTGSWSFAVRPEEKLDLTEILGTEGVVRWSTFEPRLEVVTAAGREDLTTPFPNPVHLGLVEMVVAALRGEGECPSTGESGARTNAVVDQVLGLG